MPQCSARQSTSRCVGLGRNRKFSSPMERAPPTACSPGGWEHQTRGRGPREPAGLGRGGSRASRLGWAPWSAGSAHQSPGRPAGAASRWMGAPEGSRQPAWLVLDAGAVCGPARGPSWPGILNLMVQLCVGRGHSRMAWQHWLQDLGKNPRHSHTITSGIRTRYWRSICLYIDIYIYIYIVYIYIYNDMLRITRPFDARHTCKPCPDGPPPSCR